MIPLQNTLPYESAGEQIYIHECPFCGERIVMLKLKKHDLQAIRDGRKKTVVFPCCHEKITVLDADADYLLTDRPLR